MKTASLAALTSALFVGCAAAIGACGDDTTTTGAPDASSPDAPASVDAGGLTDGSTSQDGSSNVDSSTKDGGGDAGATAIVVGLVYAGRYNNIDQRTPLALLGADGRILGYDAGPNEAPFATTAVVDGVFSDAFSGATRWTNGDIGGPFYDDAGVKPIALNDGQHMGIAKVAGSLPASGTATYTLVSATKPTFRNAVTAEGTVTGGTLTADFAGNAGTHIAFSLVVTMPDATFVLDSKDAGGGSFGQDGGFRFTGADLTVSTDAGTCAGGACAIGGGTRIVFSGPNAERVIIAYVFSAGSIATTHHGVAVFAKQ